MGVGGIPKKYQYNSNKIDSSSKNRDQHDDKQGKDEGNGDEETDSKKGSFIPESDSEKPRLSTPTAPPNIKIIHIPAEELIQKKAQNALTDPPS